MSEDQKTTKTYVRKYVDRSGGTGFAYFLGMIGAAIFYLQQATGFWDVVVALLKALVWPAFLVYHLLH